MCQSEERVAKPGAGAGEGKGKAEEAEARATQSARVGLLRHWQRRGQPGEADRLVEQFLQ